MSRATGDAISLTLGRIAVLALRWRVYLLHSGAEKAVICVA